MTGDGEVKWMLAPQVKSKVFGNSMIIAVPREPGAKVQVIAVGSVGGKLSGFVSCTITTSGTAARPGTGAVPQAPAGPVASGKVFVTVVINLAAATQAETQLAYSQSLRAAIKTQGGVYNVYADNDPVLRARSAQNPNGINLLPFYQQLGSPAIFLVQNERGDVVKSGKLPSSEAELLGLLK